VGSDLDKEKIRLFPLRIGDKLKQDAQVVTGAAGPGAGQTAFQFMGGELGCEWIRLQESQGRGNITENMADA